MDTDMTPEQEKEIREKQQQCEHEWKIISYWGVRTYYARRQCKVCKLAQDKEITEDGWVKSPQYELSESDILRENTEKDDDWEINWKSIMVNKMFDLSVSPKIIPTILDSFDHILNHRMEKYADARVNERLEAVAKEVENSKSDLEERRKQLTGKGGCSKTNRRYNMKLAKGKNNGLEYAIAIIRNAKSKV